MSDALDQQRLLEKARRATAEANQTFLFMVQNGLTGEDLQRLIEKDPETWMPYCGWLEKLPWKSKLPSAESSLTN
jgi:hypothetical protein